VITKAVRTNYYLPQLLRTLYDILYKKRWNELHESLARKGCKVKCIAPNKTQLQSSTLIVVEENNVKLNG
jgi:hypothetical protein